MAILWCRRSRNPSKGQVDCTGPRSSYDESKRCTKSLLFEMQRTQGLDVKIVRPFNIYGPRTRSDDGRAVSNFITQALRVARLPYSATAFSHRSWGYVDDVVDGFARYFWMNETDYKGPLNVGNDRRDFGSRGRAICLQARWRRADRLRAVTTAGPHEQAA